MWQRIDKRSFSSIYCSSQLATKRCFLAPLLPAPRHQCVEAAESCSSFAEQRCGSLEIGAGAWGAGIGIFGMGLGAAAGSLNATLAKTSPDSLKIFQARFPKIDITSAGGFLQLAFVELGFVIIGFAAMTLVSGWASD